MIDNLIVCQNTYIITNKNAKYTCCDYNIEIDSCYLNNYIVLHFDKNCNYSNGFKNKYRDGITFIIYNNITKSINDELEIMADSEIQIHFDTRILIISFHKVKIKILNM